MGRGQNGVDQTGQHVAPGQRQAEERIELAQGNEDAGGRAEANDDRVRDEVDDETQPQQPQTQLQSAGHDGQDAGGDNV